MDNDLVQIIIASGGVGIVLPLILSVIMQPGWSKQLKGLVAFGASAVMGTFVAWLAGGLDLTNVTAAVTSVLFITQNLYQQFYKPADIAPAIERETSAGVKG